MPHDFLQKAAYLLVTWLVESRAMRIYEKYEEVLKSSNHQFSISGILREEANHLDDLGKQAQFVLIENGFNPKIIEKIEYNQFEALWEQIENSVFNANSNLDFEVIP